jgi:hypothetical protein
LWQICKLHKTLLSGLANEKLLMMVSATNHPILLSYLI